MYSSSKVGATTNTIPISGTRDPSLLRLRYYNPNLGQFMSFDDFEGPISDPMSLHKYNYGNGNPIANTDPSGMFAEGLKGLLISTGIQAGLYALTFGSIRFGFAKARGLSTAAAFREGLTTAGWSALFAIPVVGHVLSGISLYQTYEGFKNGDYDEMDRLELATYLTASLILGRAGPKLAGQFTGAVEPPLGTQLPITSRLSILFSRLRGRQGGSPKESMAILAREMKAVEDAYSGVPYEANPGLNTSGRMYPPRADNITAYPDGSVFMKSRVHRTYINKDGGITIMNRRTGQIEHQEGPRLPIPVYTDDGSN